MRVAAFRSTFAAAFHLHDVAQVPVVGAFGPGDAACKTAKPARQFCIASHATRLDQRLPLPRAGETFVVTERIVERRHQRAGCAFGAQAHINAVQRTFGRSIIQRLKERLPKLAHRRVVGIVQENQVDVGRIVQLARAHLAHGQNREAAGSFGREQPQGFFDANLR